MAVSTVVDRSYSVRAEAHVCLCDHLPGLCYDKQHAEAVKVHRMTG